MDNIQGNVSTIAVALYAILAPYIGQYVNQDVFLAIVGLILVLWSAYNPNTFAIFGNNEQSATPNTNNTQIFDNDAPVLNDEYETGADDDGC